MALNPSKLTGDIHRIMSAQLNDTREIAREISISYQGYAEAAQTLPAATMLLTGSERLKIENALAALMNGRAQAPVAANMIGNAVTAFWMAPPVASSNGGVVTSIVTPSGIARAAATDEDDAMGAARSLASSLDIMTRTVFVTHPSPALTGPIF